MAISPRQKFGILSQLRFDNRSSAERINALARHNLPSKSIDAESLNNWLREEPPFLVDTNLVKGDYFYRRMANMGQLAPSNSHGFQNRMTHTEHVAQVANRIADRMSLGPHSSHLARAIAVAHDIGHPPFSHQGEEVFREKLAEFGGDWNHDHFSIQILTEFAHGGLTFNGLPITNATLEGVVKRYRRYEESPQNLTHFQRPLSELPKYIRDLEAKEHCLHLDKWNTVEGQIASVADWLAFTVSDTRDMLNMYLHQCKPHEFVEKSKALLQQFPAAQEIWQRIEAKVVELEKKTPPVGLSKQHYQARMQTVIGMFSRELEDYLLDDVMEETLRRYTQNKHRIRHAEDVRELDDLLVQFSPAIAKQLNEYGHYFTKEVFPQILEEHVDTLNVMRRFFDMVEDCFKKPDTQCIAVDESWQNIYQSLDSDTQMEPRQRALRKRALVAQYISCNFSDNDVMYFVKQHDPEFYEQQVSTKKPGPYPQYAIPETAPVFLQRVVLAGYKEPIQR